MYRQALHLPDEVDIADAIAAKGELEALLNHRGWKRVMRFINGQEEGIMATMKLGIKPDLIFGKTRIQKYDDMQTELKAYAKIKKFIEMRIENGKRYEQRAAKAAELAQKRTSN